MRQHQVETRTPAGSALGGSVIGSERPRTLWTYHRRESRGMPLISAPLQQRHSTREYSDRPIPKQLLSDLLWAAFGINRQSGDRTAPYWRHVMVIDLCVALADGVFVYEPIAHALLRHLADDIRGQTGHQDFVATAPLNLISVAHGERMTDVSTRSVDCTPQSMQPLSAKTSICSAPRKGSQRSFEEPSTIPNWRGRCDCPISSS